MAANADQAQTAPQPQRDNEGREGGGGCKGAKVTNCWGKKCICKRAQKAHKEREGERKRERVGIVQPNMIQLPICMFATIKCVCVCVGACEWE